MTTYNHTQVSYWMLALTLMMSVFFTWVHTMASLEAPSIDSGANLLMTGIMVITVWILASFITLTTSVDENALRIKFGYGIFTKRFPLDQIASVQSVKNHWYYGWGVKVWFWPYMWIYAISGFDAVEIRMKNGRIYRIGTDVPGELEEIMRRAISTK